MSLIGDGILRPAKALSSLNLSAEVSEAVRDNRPICVTPNRRSAFRGVICVTPARDARYWGYNMLSVARLT